MMLHIGSGGGVTHSFIYYSTRWISKFVVFSHRNLLIQLFAYIVHVQKLQVIAYHSIPKSK